MKCYHNALFAFKDCYLLVIYCEAAFKPSGSQIIEIIHITKLSGTMCNKQYFLKENNIYLILAKEDG